MQPNHFSSMETDAIQFRYSYNESDLRDYISHDILRSRNARIIIGLAFVLLFLCYFGLNKPAFITDLPAPLARFFELMQISTLNVWLAVLFMVLMMLTMMIVPTQLTTKLFHGLTWDGADMLITISATGWTRETTHWYTAVRFEGLTPSVHETFSWIVIALPPNGPSLFLAKQRLSQQTIDRLHVFLPTLAPEQMPARK